MSEKKMKQKKKDFSKENNKKGCGWIRKKWNDLANRNFFFYA